MFERIVDFSLRHRGIVLLSALLTLAAGAYSFRAITVEAFPDPTDPQVIVITLFPGQPAEEVERQVGLPLERALNGTPGSIRLRNQSLFGLSSITLTFRDDVDPLFARQQVGERLRTVELPEGVVAELAPYTTAIGEVYRYTLTGSKADPMTLRTLQDWVVEPRLSRVDGVADVVSYGGLVREVHVRPDPLALASHDLTLSDVADAIENASLNASGGVLERGAEQLLVRSAGLFSKLEDLRQVAVASIDGTPVFLGDVATVGEGWAPRQGVVGRDEDHDTVQGMVLMRRGENPSELLKRIHAAIAELDERLAQDGVELVPFYDRSDLVSTTLRTVGRNVSEGALLVVLVLAVFLMNLRAAILVALIIPLALSTAFTYLHLRGMSANLLSIGAVDFGIVVDGAVVIVESLLLRLSPRWESKDEEQPTMLDRIRAGCVSVIRPTLFAMSIIIAAYLPIFMLERVEGRIFKPMANTIVSALLGALFFSVTLVPVLATVLFKKPVEPKESPVLRLVKKGYAPLLNLSLRRPALVLSVALVVLGGTLFVGSRLGSEFLPDLNEGALYVTITLPPNTSLSEGRKLAPQVAELIRSHPQVKGVMTQLGRPEDGTDPKLTNNLEAFISLKPPKEWPKETPDLNSVLEVVEASLAVIPGLEMTFSQPIREEVNENLSGQQGQIALKLYGYDLDSLQEKAEIAKVAIEQTEGAADVAVVLSGVVPQLDVHPNRHALARHGLSMGDFQDAFQTALAGKSVAEYWEGERRFDVVLRLPEVAREDVDTVRRVRIPVPGGALVPLEELAEVKIGTGRAAINREDGRRYIGLRSNVRGRDLGTFVAEAQTRVAEAVGPLASGESLKWGGEFENKERAAARLKLTIPLALLVTLGLLYSVFNSLPLAFLILLNIPFALVGGVFALFIADMPLSVAASVGFITLVGQASLNGVLILSAVSERRKRGEELVTALREGCLERLRPNLMTGILASFGLVPAALSRSIGSETQRPIAVVIVIGALSAAFVMGVVLPASYKLAADLLGRGRRSALGSGGGTKTEAEPKTELGGGVESGEGYGQDAEVLSTG